MGLHRELYIDAIGWIEGWFSVFLMTGGSRARVFSYAVLAFVQGCAVS